MDVIQEKLKLLPEAPGVYVMLDHLGQIIYVGKAKVLKNRVRQYFFNSQKNQKVMAMVSHIADFYYYITPSEIDALSLENNLIKKHKPRYNILLKDDKTYPYLSVNLKERFPTFKIVRKLKKGSAKYFGPYMQGVSASEILEIINSVYKLRNCDVTITSKPKKPCLNYQMGRCLAPCAHLTDREEYIKGVFGAIDFLNGDIKKAKEIITTKMQKSAEKEDFELALKYKGYLESLSKLGIKRLTSLGKLISADIIACEDNNIYTAVNILIVRGGRMVGGKSYSFESGAITSEERLREFILSYYGESVELPSEIITIQPIADSDIVKEFLTGVHSKSVKLTLAKKGDKKELGDMALINAKNYLSTTIDKIKHKNDMTILACKSLKELLKLKNYPKRMECYDISNISGVDKVGSMVVMTDGVIDKNQYRRFKITSFEGADDYRSHQEMMARRLNKLTAEPEKFSKPDLIIIDGGKGQLSAVKEVFDKFGVTDIDLIALAEQNEEIFTLDSNQPIVLPRSDYRLKMLQRIRDEAHRFAVSYHRVLRGKRSLSSVLDGVKGLGKIKIKALLEKFKDLSGIIGATKQELMQVDGIGEIQAQNIIDKLTKEGLK